MSDIKVKLGRGKNVETPEFSPFDDSSLLRCVFKEGCWLDLEKYDTTVSTLPDHIRLFHPERESIFVSKKDIEQYLNEKAKTNKNVQNLKKMLDSLSGNNQPTPTNTPTTTTTTTTTTTVRAVLWIGATPYKTTVNPTEVVTI